MTLPDPARFPRAFADAWSVRDARAMAALFAAEADFLTLTGHWAEGRKQIAETVAGEMAGAFARAKLVTGRTRARMLAPGVAHLMQRYVRSGILNPDGSDAGRVRAILSATLLRDRRAGRSLRRNSPPRPESAGPLPPYWPTRATPPTLARRSCGGGACR